MLSPLSSFAVRCAAFLAAAAVVAGGTAAPVQAAERLAFPDARPLTLSWDEVTAGAPISVCNVSARAVTEVSAVATGFGFERTSTDVADAAVLDVRNLPASLAPGACSEMTLVAAGEEIDPGSYAGVLAVTGAGAGILRREVTVEGADSTTVPSKISAPGKPPSKLSATRRVPFTDDVTLDEGLPLVRTGSGDPALVAEDEEIGNVFGHGEVGALKVAGAPQLQAGAALLPLDVSGLSHVGDYTGTVQPVGPDGVKIDPIEVTVTVTDAWPWAVAAIVLGAALGLLPQLWTRRWRLEGDLHDRRRALPGAYRVAFSYWSEHRREHPALPALRLSPAAAAGFDGEVDAAIRTYARGAFLFDPAAAAYLELGETLAKAEADVACLRDEDGLAGALDTLHTTTDEVAAFVCTAFPAQRKPRVLAAARAPFKPVAPKTSIELTVGEATARAATAKTLTALLVRWRELAGEVRRYELWALMLGQLGAVPERLGGLRERDAARLDKAHACVREAHQELLDVEDGDELERVGAERDLREAYALLARLGGRYGVWAPAELADPEPTCEITTNAALRGIVDLGKAAEALTFARSQLGDVFSGTVGFVLEPLRTLTLIPGARSLWDAAVFVLAVVVGIVAGLNAFYFGKTFGTVPDYLLVIATGAGAQFLVKGVTDALSGMLAPPAAELADAGAAAAGTVEIVPKAAKADSKDA